MCTSQIKQDTAIVEKREGQMSHEEGRRASHHPLLFSRDTTRREKKPVAWHLMATSIAAAYTNAVDRRGEQSTLSYLAK